MILVHMSSIESIAETSASGYMILVHLCSIESIIETQRDSTAQVETCIFCRYGTLKHSLEQPLSEHPTVVRILKNYKASRRARYISTGKNKCILYNIHNKLSLPPKLKLMFIKFEMIHIMSYWVCSALQFLNFIVYHTLSGHIGKVVASHAEGCKIEF